MKNLLTSLLLFAAPLTIFGIPSTENSKAFSSLIKASTQVVNVDGRYQMTLPKYLSPDSSLNREASLQFANIFKEVYIIVIDESREMFLDMYWDSIGFDSTKSALENYSNSQMSSIHANMKTVTYESEFRILQTQSGKSLVKDISGFQDGIEDEMGFTVAFIEGKFNLYMVMTWTFAKTKKTYQRDMDNMIISFKELSGSVITVPYFEEYTHCTFLTPGDCYVDSSIMVKQYGIASYVAYDRQFCIAVAEHKLEDWDGDPKPFASTLDYFTISQRNFMYKHYDTLTTTEVVSAKVDDIPVRTFEFHITQNGEKWIHYFMMIQGAEVLHLVEIYFPAENLEANKNDVKLVFDSFREL